MTVKLSTHKDLFQNKTIQNRSVKNQSESVPSAFYKKKIKNIFLFSEQPSKVLSEGSSSRFLTSSGVDSSRGQTKKNDSVYIVCR